jgi:hypothetical protein
VTFTKANNIELVIPRGALEIVFDECDRYDADETGGRVLGTYESRGSALAVSVNGVIEPGPGAKRTATYFKQDGSYQERVFREVEQREPTVEHLGNWHTHHVNGLRHLSDGDIETYRRTVEHKNHNTDFFYALLVIERKPGKTGLQRYIFKNYVLRRGDPEVYEIPSSALRLIDAPLVWPSVSASASHGTSTPHMDEGTLKQNRVYDRDFVSQFYPKVAPFQSRELGIYWRGPIPLIDGSATEVVVIEDSSGTTPKYTVNLRSPPEWLTRTTTTISGEGFPSCRAALLTTERMCNAELYEKRPDRKGKRKWMF